MITPFIKTILPASYDYGEPIAMLVDIHKQGLDSAWMSKRSAAGVFKNLELKPEKNHSYIHLIAMGDADYYGANRNGDLFMKKGCTIDIPAPADGKSFKVKVDVGNQETHYTFKKFGKVYRHHQNKDPNKAHGDVYATAHNDDMSRVELMIRVPNAGWSKDLEKLASGDDLSFSMSCVADPDYPVLTIDGYKAIKNVTTADKVLTHTGNWRQVTAVNRRRYTGKLHTFAVNGLPLPLEITADHPMFVKLFSGSRRVVSHATMSRYFKDSDTYEAVPPGWAHAEHVSVGDRFIYQPIRAKIPGVAAIDSIPLATLMGYYLAEGSFTYNGERACTVQFTCNMGDSLPRRVPALVEDIMPGITCHIAPHRLSPSALVVNVSNTEFSGFLWNYVGRHSAHKYICNEIFNASDACKLALLGAWLDGDGWVDKKGAHWSTCNQYLALQGRDLLASVGVPASIYKINHAGQPGYVGTGIEYTVNVSHLDLLSLMPYSSKVADRNIEFVPTQNKAAALRICPDGRYAYRVKSVSTRDVVDIPTYNIEVDTDESYTLAGMISHNCKVPFDICTECANKARNRSEYCEHAKHHMGEITKAGNQIGVVNDHMLYFDISQVQVPADRIAFGLLKAASVGSGFVSGADLSDQMTLFPPMEPVDLLSGATLDKLAAIGKLSEIEKEIALTGAGTPDDGESVGECLMAFGPETYKRELSDSELNDLSVSRDTVPDLLGALTDAKIVLSIKDFLRIIMGKRFDNVKEHLGAASDLLPGIFGRIANAPHSMLSDLDDFELGSGVIPRKARDTVHDLVSGMSLGDEPMGRRVTITILRGKTPPQMKSAGLGIVEGSASPLARRMATVYAMYKLAACQRMGLNDRVLLRRAILQHYVVA